MSHFPERRGDFATGNVSGIRLFLGMALSLVVAASMAVLLEVAYRYNLYFYLVAPALAGSVVGGAVYLTVDWGRCRNRVLAVSLGALAGALMYCGYFYADFVVEAGIENAARVEKLPDFVIWRVEKAVTKVGAGKARNEGRTFNWLLLLADFGSAIYIVSHFAMKAARRAYCEHCGNWQKHMKLKLEPGVAAQIADALRQGRLDCLPPYAHYVPVEGCAFDEIVLEYCHATQQCDPCPMHLTLDEHRASSLRTHLNKTAVMSQEEISAAALAALARGNPAFAKVARDCDIKLGASERATASHGSLLEAGV